MLKLEDLKKQLASLTQNRDLVMAQYNQLLGMIAVVTQQIAVIEKELEAAKQEQASQEPALPQGELENGANNEGTQETA